MTPPLSRRTLLRTAILAAAAPGFAGAAAGGAAAAPLPAPSAWQLRPFALKDVALGRGLFATKRALTRTGMI